MAPAPTAQDNAELGKYLSQGWVEVLCEANGASAKGGGGGTEPWVMAGGWET